jgi:hypothetical protein
MAAPRLDLDSGSMLGRNSKQLLAMRFQSRRELYRASRPQTEPRSPPAPDPPAPYLPYRKLNPVAAMDGCPEMETSRSLDFGLMPAVGRNSELSPEPAVKFPPWRELNPVAACELWSPRRADPPSDVSALAANSAPHSPSLYLPSAPWAEPLTWTESLRHLDPAFDLELHRILRPASRQPRLPLPPRLLPPLQPLPQQQLPLLLSRHREGQGLPHARTLAMVRSTRDAAESPAGPWAWAWSQAVAPTPLENRRK